MRLTDRVIHPSAGTPALAGQCLTLGYRDTTVVHDASLSLHVGLVTALVGPNGSGKSTLLRALARLHKVTSGRVDLDDGVAADELSSRAFARRVTLLSQSRPNPHGLAVADVVAFGRHPHRRRFGALGQADREAVAWAMDVTGTSEMSTRPVDELSGGERGSGWPPVWRNAPTCSSSTNRPTTSTCASRSRSSTWLATLPSSMTSRSGWSCTT